MDSNSWSEMDEPDCSEAAPDGRGQFSQSPVINQFLSQHPRDDGVPYIGLMIPPEGDTDYSQLASYPLAKQRVEHLEQELIPYQSLCESAEQPVSPSSVNTAANIDPLGSGDYFPSAAGNHYQGDTTHGSAFLGLNQSGGQIWPVFYPPLGFPPLGNHRPFGGPEESQPTVSGGFSNPPSFFTGEVFSSGDSFTTNNDLNLPQFSYNEPFLPNFSLERSVYPDPVDRHVYASMPWPKSEYAGRESNAVLDYSNLEAQAQSGVGSIQRQFGNLSLGNIGTERSTEIELPDRTNGYETGDSDNGAPGSASDQYSSSSKHPSPKFLVSRRVGSKRVRSKRPGPRRPVTKRPSPTRPGLKHRFPCPFFHIDPEHYGQGRWKLCKHGRFPSCHRTRLV